MKEANKMTTNELKLKCISGDGTYLKVTSLPTSETYMIHLLLSHGSSMTVGTFNQKQVKELIRHLTKIEEAMERGIDWA